MKAETIERPGRTERAAGGVATAPGGTPAAACC